MKNMEKPKKETYGWHNQNSFDGLPSGWMYEGGEEKYHEAIKEWELTQCEDTKFQSNVTELINTLRMHIDCKVINTQYFLKNCQLAVDLLSEIFEIEKEPQPGTQQKYTLAQITKAVCKVCDVTIDELQSKSRQRNISDAKHIFRNIAIEKGIDVSYTKIANASGGKRHCSVSSSIKTFDELKKTDKEFSKKYVLVLGELMEKGG